jgi:hypothetical protein
MASATPHASGGHFDSIPFSDIKVIILRKKEGRYTANPV